MVDDVDGDEEGIVDVVLDDNAIRQASPIWISRPKIFHIS